MKLYRLLSMLPFLTASAHAEEKIRLEITGPCGITETPVRVPSRDILLDAVLTVPQTDAEKYPMAILTHGFTSDHRTCARIAEYLGRHGIASLRISLTGSGKSGGRYEDSDFDTQADDIVNALHYAKALDITDTKNLFLFGASQGGFDSALAALRTEDEINALCMWYPALCIPDDFRAGRVQFVPFDVKNPPETLVINPAYTVGRKMIEQGLAMHVEKELPAFGKNVLIVHGDRDAIVDVRYSREIAPLYPSATLTILPNAGHGFDGQTELAALAYTLAFIENNLVK